MRRSISILAGLSLAVGLAYVGFVGVNSGPPRRIHRDVRQAKAKQLFSAGRQFETEHGRWPAQLDELAGNYIVVDAIPGLKKEGFTFVAGPGEHRAVRWVDTKGAGWEIDETGESRALP